MRSIIYLFSLILGLIKIGIDPEAYCFLCKKEFCSKYFLRTHKLNIHGIKSEETPRGTITPPTSISPISSHLQLQNQTANPLPVTTEDQWRWREQVCWSDMYAISILKIFLMVRFYHYWWCLFKKFLLFKVLQQ